MMTGLPISEGGSFDARLGQYLAQLHSFIVEEHERYVALRLHADGLEEEGNGMTLQKEGTFNGPVAQERPTVCSPSSHYVASADSDFDPIRPSCDFDPIRPSWQFVDPARPSSQFVLDSQPTLAPQKTLARSDTTFSRAMPLFGKHGHTIFTERSFAIGDMLNEDVVKNFERLQPYLGIERSKWKYLREFTRCDAIVRVLTSVSVLSNIVVLGFEANSSWHGWLVVDSVYAFIFFMEIVYKFYAEGYFYIHPKNPDYQWGWFDIALTILSIFDVIVTASFSEDQDANANQYAWMRIARLVRLARILRLLQLDMLGDLLLMINGAVGGLRTLGWSLVMIAVPIYVFALFFTETLGQYADPKSDEFNVAEHFSSIPRSMFTGFRCLVVGDCSSMNGTPIFPHVMNKYGWAYGLVYALTSVCMSFGLFNVIISIYVENTVEAAKSNEMLQRQRRLTDQEHFTEKILNLSHFLWTHFKTPGLRRTGFKFEDAMHLEITEEMFGQIIQMPETKNLLSDLDVPREDQIDLFDICDADASGSVSMDELVAGIKRLRGDPRRSDIVYVMLRVREVLSEMQNLKSVCFPKSADSAPRHAQRSPASVQPSIRSVSISTVSEV